MSRVGQWAMLVFRLPREPSTPRVAVWRRLRRLGVAHLLDNLVALPLDARNREQLEWVADQVVEAGGQASIWLARPATAAEERSLVDAMRAAIDAEYRQVAAAAREVGGEAPGWPREAARLREQLRRIRQRDHFASRERLHAARAIEEMARTRGQRR